MNSSGRMQKIMDRADLCEESFAGVPVVEMVGDQRVLIEGHCGVTNYSVECVCVKVKYGVISVIGMNLELARMTGKQVVVTGRIDSVQIRREERA